jgi:hypothetical protein
VDTTDRGSKPDHAVGDPRPVAVTFVTTEHFTLQSARSSTISESTGRAGCVPWGGIRRPDRSRARRHRRQDRRGVLHVRAHSPAHAGLRGAGDVPPDAAPSVSARTTAVENGPPSSTPTPRTNSSACSPTSPPHRAAVAAREIPCRSSSGAPNVTATSKSRSSMPPRDRGGPVRRRGQRRVAHRENSAPHRSSGAAGARATAHLECTVTTPTAAGSWSTGASADWCSTFRHAVTRQRARRRGFDQLRSSCAGYG